MTPPLCMGCHVHPVRRVYGKPESIGPRRMSDGVRWGNYCSKACSARAMGRRQAATGANVSRMKDGNRQAFRGRVVARLKAAADPLVAQYGVPAAVLMRALWDSEKRGYYRGYGSAWAARRRALLA
jgi:hypothetical protein